MNPMDSIPHIRVSDPINRGPLAEFSREKAAGRFLAGWILNSRIHSRAHPVFESEWK